MGMDRKQQETMIGDFSAMLYQKGYRGRYEMDSIDGAKIFMAGKLSECLEQIISLYNRSDLAEQKFLLKTRPPYNDKIGCSFKTELDMVKGFLVREMDIHDSVSRQSRHYRIDHHRTIPGSNAIEGLFPKPKPWEHILKGKLRR